MYTIATAALISILPLLATAVPCVQFDTSWNLYAFGGSQDVNLGKSSSWAQPAVIPLTATGRPPWTGNNTQCFLSDINNAMYVLGADSSDLSKIYIYNFGSSSWSTQATTSPPTSWSTRSSSILDHDTNVIFTYSGGGLTQLDMSAVTSSAQSSALAWEGVSAPTWASGYGSAVTAAQSSNHIMYFGVPSTAAGSAQMFVIHYAYWQPQAQTFPTAGGGQSFPNVGGQAISVPGSSSDYAPNQAIFIPSDFSNTYVVNHWTNPSTYTSTSGSPYAVNLINTTSILPAPSSRDTNAAYAASPNSLVQITTGGDIYYISNAVSNGAAVSGASWTKMSYSLAGGSSSASASGSASGSATASGSASGTGTRSTSGTGTTTAGAASASATTSRAAAGEVADIGRGWLGLAASSVMMVFVGMGLIV